MPCGPGPGSVTGAAAADPGPGPLPVASLRPLAVTARPPQPRAARAPTRSRAAALVYYPRQCRPRPQAGIMIIMPGLEIPNSHAHWQPTDSEPRPPRPRLGAAQPTMVMMRLRRTQAGGPTRTPGHRDWQWQWHRLQQSERRPERPCQLCTQCVSHSSDSESTRGPSATMNLRRASYLDSALEASLQLAVFSVL